jgi:hypothetical protein
MKPILEIAFSGETYSCECAVKVTDTFASLIKNKFRCNACGGAITCAIDLKNDEQLKFQRVDCKCVKEGDIVILGHPNLKLRYEVLGINSLENYRIVSLKGYGGHRVHSDSTICVIPLEWR